MSKPYRLVRVDLGTRGYDVVIGRALLPRFPELLAQAAVRSPYAILYDEQVKNLSFGAFELNDLLPDSVRSCIQPGEPSKSLERYTSQINRLAQQKIPRTGTVIAVGGGVIGDLAGFVAATYLRGIAWIQVPTTLLAMVDSSVGGKTGVNLPEGKNLVGAFHQPKLVVADLDTLATLPGREFSAGLAEVIKYGAIRDEALFARLSMGVDAKDIDLDEIVEKCVAIKARIVERDEFETTGERALLNFGHTIGHAIEKATGYTRYLHGEAIALGIKAAAWLSVWQNGLPEKEATRLEAALVACGLPTQLDAAVDRGAILAALGNDKKVDAAGQNRWVLLERIGVATSGHELPRELVERAVEVLSPA
jgi:3-dehydroquinate synthase